MCFIVIITLIDFVMFIVALAIGGTPRGIKTASLSLLTPYAVILWHFGEKDFYAMKSHF